MGCCISQRYPKKGNSAVSSAPLLSEASETTFGAHLPFRSSEEKSDRPLSTQRDTNAAIRSAAAMTVNQSFQMVIGSPLESISGTDPLSSSTDPLAGRPMKSTPTQILRRDNAVQLSLVGNFKATRPQTLREDEELVDMNEDMDVNRYRIANLSPENDDEAHPEEVDLNVFRYGEYLEYWRNRGGNRVWPKYTNLKQELLHNKVANITEVQYKELHKKAERLLQGTSLKAKRVGSNNKVCGIEVGSAPTVYHMIALLIYTDFKNHQFQFKKQCRRLYTNKPLRDLVRGNSEIYHWSKLIKEMCIFLVIIWAKTMYCIPVWESL